MTRDALLEALGGPRRSEVVPEEFDPMTARRLPARTVIVTTDLDAIDPGDVPESAERLT